MESVLVTGGTGFIGSHTVVELCKQNYNVVVIDNLVNSKIDCLHRVEKIVGRPITHYTVNLLDEAALEDIFERHKFDYVIHCAALKAVSESIKQPIRYYKNNLIGAINLLNVMTRFGARNFVFSSSATVYGDAQYLPIDEAHPVGSCSNPYGRSKFFIEEMARDVQLAHPEMNILLLRYFNPVGAHESGEIGEDPLGVPNNLMPYVAQVAIGRRPHVVIYGDDYDTPDGTAVRDYVHVVDLALGHVAALGYLRRRLTEPLLNDDKYNLGEMCVLNLGAGRGYSVREMITAMERASGRPIPYCIAPRRAGDCPTFYGDTRLSEQYLGWKATRDIDQICKFAFETVSLC